MNEMLELNMWDLSRILLKDKIVFEYDKSRIDCNDVAGANDCIVLNMDNKLMILLQLEIGMKGNDMTTMNKGDMSNTKDDQLMSFPEQQYSTTFHT